MADKKVTGSAFDSELFRRILSYALKYKKVFYSTALLSVVIAVITPVRPYIVQYVVDEVIPKGNESLLWQMLLLLIFVLVIDSVLNFLYVFASNWVGQQVIRDMRNQIFQHLLSFKLKYFDKSPIGMLVTRTVSDINTISESFSNGIFVIIGDLLKVVVVIGFMFYTNWRLTLMSLIPLPILFIATAIFKRVIKSAFQQVREQVSNLNTFVQEHIMGMSIVQLFNREKVQMAQFKEINEKHKQAHIKTVWAYSIFFPIVEMLSALSIAFLVWYGFGEVVEGVATSGMIFSFIMYINMLYRPIRMLADRFNTLQLGMVSAERVFKILDKNEVIVDEGSYEVEDLKGAIRFENVWFAYKEDHWVLKDISLHVKPGETIALVGATGSGKSSIINLLSRFYEINKGELFIDQRRIQEYNISCLRKEMAIVLQDVFLFSDSIINNIKMYDETISDQTVFAAAKLIGVHDFIENLSGGYSYQVSERGEQLSVGQRQLIAFVRAYVHNPQLLILDEATSSIDTLSESLIENAVKILTKDRTAIIIAHRLSTIQHADQILVLDQGAIIERGNHEDLLAKEGAYSKLHAYQFSQLGEES